MQSVDYFRQLLDQDDIVLHAVVHALGAASAAADDDSSPAPTCQTSCSTVPATSIRIPHMILYAYGKPVAWFATTAEGLIRRRGDRRLAAAAIVEELGAPPTLRRGLVTSSCFVAPVVPAMRKRSARPELLVDVSTPAKGGQAGLRTFLQQIRGNGVLVGPVPGGRDALYLIEYTPRRMSVDLAVWAEGQGPCLTDASLHTGPYHFSEVRSDTTIALLQAACDDLSARLSARFGAPVLFLNLAIRLDEANRPFLTWCGEMKLHRPSGFGFQILRCTPTGTSKINESTAVSVPVSTHPRFQLTDPRTAKYPCDICSESTPRGLLQRVHLRWVLAALAPLDRALVGWEELVPPSIALACPSHTPEDAMALRQSIQGLQEHRQLCSNCVERCERAFETAAALHEPLPAWLGIDSQFRPAAGKSRDLGRRRTVLPQPITAGDLLPFIHQRRLRLSAPVETAAAESDAPPPLYCHRAGVFTPAADGAVVTVPSSQRGERCAVWAGIAFPAMDAALLMDRLAALQLEDDGTAVQQPQRGMHFKSNHSAKDAPPTPPGTPLVAA